MRIEPTPMDLGHGHTHQNADYKRASNCVGCHNDTQHPKKWIAGAISHPGALTKQAHAAGESPMKFAHEHEHDSGTTGKRARLAVTLQGMHHGG